MLFLNYFDPSDISPDIMVGRKEELAWLQGNFESYFDGLEQRILDNQARRILCMTGDKGSGKSILAAKLVKNLRRKYSGSTLFVSVDCRGTNGARGVVASIASGLVDEIDSFASIAQASNNPFPHWIPALASLLSTVAHADTASSKTLHQQLNNRKAVLKTGGQLMLRALKAEFDISMERAESDIKSLETSVTFDIDRLLILTTKLFQDIRNAGMRVFLLVDNVDELQHEYWDEEARKNTQATVNRVMRLIDAPIAMLLCMRTYFKGSLPRVIAVPEQLEPLSKEHLLEVVKRRVDRDTSTVQNAFQTQSAQDMIQELATYAKTPLALLTWIKWVAESRHGFSGAAQEHAKTWRDGRYADFAKAIASTLRLFAEKHAEGTDAVHRKALLAAVDDDEEAFRYLQTTELILPRDFWNPTHFVLDPSAAWIAAAS